MKLFMVVLGGALGSGLRYLTGTSLKNIQWFHFPVGVTAVNIIGCFLIGMLSVFLAEDRWNAQRLFFVTGFCGGFTTFSSFAMEQKDLQSQGFFGHQLLHLLLNNALGIFFVFIGYMLAKKWAMR